jgi:hypothetical protein
VKQGLSGAKPGSPATYLIMCHLSFDSVEAFQRAFGPRAEPILGDIKLHGRPADDSDTLFVTTGLNLMQGRINLKTGAISHVYARYSTHCEFIFLAANTRRSHHTIIRYDRRGAGLSD